MQMKRRETNEREGKLMQRRYMERKREEMWAFFYPKKLLVEFYGLHWETPFIWIEVV